MTIYGRKQAMQEHEQCSVHFLEFQHSHNVPLLKLDDWLIPRELTGVDRYYANVNSLSVPQEKMIYI
jgi:hypothetical protein